MVYYYSCILQTCVYHMTVAGTEARTNDFNDFQCACILVIELDLQLHRGLKFVSSEEVVSRHVIDIISLNML